MSIEQPNLATKVTHVEITQDQSEQRLDNFLIARLKGVPKSHIYRIVRKGEVRVNKGRVDVKYRLVTGDVVRVPPVRIAGRSQESYVAHGLQEALEQGILFEDESFMVINKPAGFAVHGGSGVSSGVIEGLRLIRPQAHFLELVHRLDKDTSGCLIIAKKRSALRSLHEQFREDRIEKTYLALLSGQWAKKQQVVDAPLLKNVSQGGERMVVISKAGKTAETLFKRLRLFKTATLVEASPKTGRTHQIRVHAASLGHPIIGDDRYGFDEANKIFRIKGYKRMFLHAKTLRLQHPVSQAMLFINAPLPTQLDDLLTHEEPI